MAEFSPELDKQLKKLKKENNALKEENQSLWDLLEEIRRSDISEHKEFLSKEIRRVQIRTPQKLIKA